MASGNTPSAEDRLLRARHALSDRKPEQTLQLCREILSDDPHNEQARLLLGTACLASGDYDGAIEQLGILAQQPSVSIDVLNNLGNAYEYTGNLGLALDCYRRALDRDSRHLAASFNYGSLLRRTGNPSEAAVHLQTALRHSPDHLQILLELGSATRSTGHARAAAEYLERAVRVAPDNAMARNALGNCYYQLGNTSRAIACYQAALHIRPDYAEACNNLGTALIQRGEVAAAIVQYKNALQLRPDWPGAASNRLLAENYICEQPEKLLALHTAWGRQMARSCTGKIAARTRRPGASIRVGYLSPDFRTHSVACFVSGIFSSHDRQRFTIICLSDTLTPDETTRRLRHLADEWHDTAGMTDEQIADLVGRLGIDILVDLAGHTAGNRLGVFAHHPAPVQASYLGYPNTTGLSAIEYRITDAEADPPGRDDSLHTECLVRLPDGFLCYAAPQGPQPATVAAAADGRVTFGSFNVLSKISPSCITVWAATLRAVPGSRLLIKSSGLEDEGTRKLLTERFAEQGISADRLDLRGRIEACSGHMDLYNSVDIALDTFPYNGTTTTFEALWMGVPVVTLSGNRHAGRVGRSIMKHAGFDFLVAADADQYVSIAAGLALDRERRAQLRSTLRQQLAASTLCNAAHQTRALENAFLSMLTPDRQASGS